MKDKLYVIRKYVKAKSAAEAVRKERSIKVDEVFMDDDWRTKNQDRLADAIGFEMPNVGFKQDK